MEHGWAMLHERLARIDPPTAARIHPNDAQRIQRMLEIHELTGEAPSVLHARSGDADLPWRISKLIVAPGTRDRLHRNISERFRIMMAEGFLAEVEKLHARPDLDLAQPAMRAVGYRQLWQSLDGMFGLEEAVDRAVIASRQLAKRQLTWLRSLDDATWLASDDDTMKNKARRLVERASDAT